MMDVRFYKDKNIPVDQLVLLYQDAGWISYLSDISKLSMAVDASLLTITAWEEDQLVGLIRVVGDGLTIVYIQDILVLKAKKRKGIGTALLHMVLDQYRDVRQKVLLTDDSIETRDFYEANGFASCDKGGIVAFAKLA